MDVQTAALQADVVNSAAVESFERRYSFVWVWILLRPSADTSPDQHERKGRPITPRKVRNEPQTSHNHLRSEGTTAAYTSEVNPSQAVFLWLIKRAEFSGGPPGIQLAARFSF